MKKLKLTADDLNKTLADLGFKEGDEIVVPLAETNANEQQSNENEQPAEGIEVPKKTPPPEP